MDACMSKHDWAATVKLRPIFYTCTPARPFFQVLRESAHSRSPIQAMAHWGVMFLLAAIVLAQGDDSDVLELDADTFDDGIAAPIMLVEFYAPW